MPKPDTTQRPRHSDEPGSKAPRILTWMPGQPRTAPSRGEAMHTGGGDFAGLRSGRAVRCRTHPTRRNEKQPGRTQPTPGEE